jgi:hypothetical protein
MRKYTTKVEQAQLVGNVEIRPYGGDLKDDQVAAIIADPYGKDLIRKGKLTIEGVKPEDLEEKKKPRKPKEGYRPQPEAPKPTGSGDQPKQEGSK